MAERYRQGPDHPRATYGWDLASELARKNRVDWATGEDSLATGTYLTGQIPVPLFFRDLPTGRSYTGAAEDTRREWIAGMAVYDARMAAQQTHLGPGYSSPQQLAGSTASIFAPPPSPTPFIAPPLPVSLLPYSPPRFASPPPPSSTVPPLAETQPLYVSPPAYHVPIAPEQIAGSDTPMVVQVPQPEFFAPPRVQLPATSVPFPSIDRGFTLLDATVDISGLAWYPGIEDGGSWPLVRSIVPGWDYQADISTHTQEKKDPCPNEWTAAFHNRDLDLPGTLKANGATCEFEIPPKGRGGSSPRLISLPIILNTDLGENGKKLQVYAGWPLKGGKKSGVTQSTDDQPPIRRYEDKIGPTIVWAVCCCQDVCISAVTLKYTIKISRKGEPDHFIEKIESPKPDGWKKVNGGCLSPRFVSEKQVKKSPFMGAIDQPGLVVTNEGAGYKDTSGKDQTIKKGDRAEIEFRHRAFVLCDNSPIAITDWGFKATAVLGARASEIELESIAEGDPIKVDMYQKDDADQTKKAAFDKAAKEFDEMRAKEGLK